VGSSQSNIGMQFNADTGTDYAFNAVYASSGAQAFNQVNQNYTCCALGAPDGFSTFELWIPTYSDTGSVISTKEHSGTWDYKSAAGFVGGTATGWWNSGSATPITDIVVRADGFGGGAHTGFAVGSTIDLYGV